jgi:hypothetical protein
MSMPRRSCTANSHQKIDSGTVDCPLPHENEPHQTFANRDPRAVRRGRQVPNRVAGLRQKAPHTNMINRQGVACAPLGKATTMRGCRTPRSSHRRPDNKRTFRAPPSLNVSQDLLWHPEPRQRGRQSEANRACGGPLHHRRDHTNRLWSSTPVTTFASRSTPLTGSRIITPPTMSTCHNCIGPGRCQRT